MAFLISCSLSSSKCLSLRQGFKTGNVFDILHQRPSAPLHHRAFTTLLLRLLCLRLLQLRLGLSRHLRQLLRARYGTSGEHLLDLGGLVAGKLHGERAESLRKGWGKRRAKGERRTLSLRACTSSSSCCRRAFKCIFLLSATAYSVLASSTARRSLLRRCSACSVNVAQTTQRTGMPVEYRTWHTRARQTHLFCRYRPWCL